MHHHHSVLLRVVVLITFLASGIPSPLAAQSSVASSNSMTEDMAAAMGIPETGVYIKAVKVVSAQSSIMVLNTDYGIIANNTKSDNGMDVLAGMEALSYGPDTLATLPFTIDNKSTQLASMSVSLSVEGFKQDPPVPVKLNPSKSATLDYSLRGISFQCRMKLAVQVQYKNAQGKTAFKTCYVPYAGNAYTISSGTVSAEIPAQAEVPTSFVLTNPILGL